MKKLWEWLKTQPVASVVVLAIYSVVLALGKIAVFHRALLFLFLLGILAFLRYQKTRIAIKIRPMAE